MRMMRGFPWTAEKGAKQKHSTHSSGQDPADMGTAFGLEASLEAEADQAGFNPMHAAGAEGRATSDLPHGMTDRLNRRSVI